MSFMSVVETLALVRTFRWVWQNTESCLLEISIFHLISALLENSQSFVHLNLEVSGLDWLVIISFARDRLGQVLDKLFMFLVLTATSMENRASRQYNLELFIAITYL